MKTKLEIINETAEYYGADPSRRAYDGRCHYRMEKEAGQCYCAFGRCMEPWALDQAERKNVTSEAIEGLLEDLSVDEVNEILKPEYHDHDFNFWLDLQTLHDTDRFYEGTGLSRAGNDYVITLRERWGKY